jgi:hypothetical protein
LPFGGTKGGPISWTFLVASNFLIGWIGMGVWYYYFGETHLGMFLAGGVMMMVGYVVAYGSNRGFLVILTTFLIWLTFFLIDIIIEESYGFMLFLFVITLGALLIHHKK